MSWRPTSGKCCPAAQSMFQMVCPASRFTHSAVLLASHGSENLWSRDARSQAVGEAATAPGPPHSCQEHLSRLLKGTIHDPGAKNQPKHQDLQHLHLPQQQPQATHSWALQRRASHTQLHFLGSQACSSGPSKAACYQQLLLQQSQARLQQRKARFQESQVGRRTIARAWKLRQQESQD